MIDKAEVGQMSEAGILLYDWRAEVNLLPDLYAVFPGLYTVGFLMFSN